MNNETHISSLVLRVIPSAVTSLEREVARYSYSELGVSDQKLGKLVVVLETPGMASLKEAINHFEQLDDVLTATMVYHHVDTAPSVRHAVV